MSKRDWIAIIIIGAGVGLLIQPILGNNLPAHDLPYLTLPVRFGMFLFFMIFAPFALFIARMLSRWFRGIYQFAQFAAVGTLNSFIDIGVFNLETALFGSTMISNVLFATFKAISFLFGTTNSFVWNKYWTFDSRDKTNAGEIGGFYGIAIVGWIINVTVATLVKAAGPVDSKTWINIVAPLAGIAASFVWNYTGYKLWVFKRRN
jgi:putative flippase GtrA